MVIRFIILALSVSSAVNAKTLAAVNEQWAGRWVHVERIEKVLPAEEPFRSVNVYDVVIIKNVTSESFEYMNVANDVGYGPNEMTISQGVAVFVDKSHALDKKTGLKISFYQGKENWDRGISVNKTDSSRAKFFKQIRTQFNSSFNCKKAGTYIEKMICSDAVIAQADKELGQLYRKLRKSLDKNHSKKLRSSQIQWNKKRNKACQNKIKANVQCLSSEYASRLLLLRKMTVDSSVSAVKSVDAEYMKELHGRSPNLWDDTVLRLIFKSHNQNEFVKQSMAYQVSMKASFDDSEAVFTGKIEYETIVWPANAQVTINYQLVVDKNADTWFSTRYSDGRHKEAKTIFGPKDGSKTVKDWIKKMK